MKSMIHKYLPSLVYPVVMSGGIALYLLLQSAFPAQLWTAYMPALLSTLIVTLFEKSMPAHHHWQPDKEDIKNDIAFMLLVQVLLPLALGLAVIAWLYPVSSHLIPALTAFWPHGWPLVLQAVLLLVTAELINYWVHRLAHTIPVLWRFHAVHHSSEKLYWLNVGRFHPLEKIWQYTLISMPFMLLGVAQDVIGLYFVFYAINGFFQHSNIRLSYGWLNYLVSSAELHRWHHSPDQKISNHNYGNNLVVWDLVFGSWYLPRYREIDQVGSGIHSYPQRFFALLIRPFNIRPNGRLARWFFTLRGKRVWQRFMQHSRHPSRTQSSVLKHILQYNKDTEYGRQYGFEKIRNHKDYMREVPICSYEDIEPLIQKQAQTGLPVLLQHQPVFYARTSGTTGMPKDIPITAQGIEQFRYQQQLLSYYQYLVCPQAFVGKALGVVSPAVEGHTELGDDYGSVSGYIYKTMPAMIRDRYLVPAEVFEISDYDLKYRIILRLALAQPNITYLGSANPSTFLRLRDILNNEWSMLLQSLQTASVPGIESFSAELQAILQERIRPEPEIHARLRKLSGQGEIEFRDIWPDIHLLTTWTAGNCQFALQRLRDSLPAHTQVIELGYIATELRGTLTCDQKSNAGIPLLAQVYYEFVEKHAWENGVRETLTIEQLQYGRAYYIIVSTQYGLYRYFMNDLLEVRGFLNKTPLLRFLQKGIGVTNITGEKLYEAQVNRAIDDVCQLNHLRLRFFMTLANVVKARYQIYLEAEDHHAINAYAIAAQLDDALAANNIEYAGKRKSGRLRAPQVFFLRPGCGDAFKRYQIDCGQREGQFKYVSLQDKRDFQFNLKHYVMDYTHATGHVSNF